MQPQANVDWIQVAWFEAAKAQHVEPGKTCTQLLMLKKGIKKPLIIRLSS